MKIRTALAMLATPALLAAGLASPAEAAQPRTWKLCLNESTMNCVYDAKHMGNGGQSYIRWQQGPAANHKVILRFISHEQAHRLALEAFGER